MTDLPLRPSSQKPSPQRMAAAYVLGLTAICLLIALWLRGAGRFLVPLLLIGGVAWVLLRIVHKIREPLP